MPLQDIPIIGVHGDTKIRTINSTLSLLSRGLNLCIEAIIMASDAGYVEQGEEIIVFSADTAIVATGCRKEWLILIQINHKFQKSGTAPSIFQNTFIKFFKSIFSTFWEKS